LASHPYRSSPSKAPAPGPGGLERAWRQEAAVPLIVASVPLALVALCEGFRIFVGESFMPETILYGAIAYAAVVIGICAIDVARR
jgi:hypothetical protein